VDAAAILRDAHCADRHGLLQLLARIEQRLRKQQACDQLQQKLHDRFQHSAHSVAQRRGSIPSVSLNSELPFFAQQETLAEAIADNQVVILCGETGSGKTTQLPQLCLQLGLGARGFIGHTQPRRIAARSVANRIAEELGDRQKQRVGCKIRFADQSQPGNLLKLMTDGMLLAEIAQDRFLNQYEVIIIDEAHERSLNIDFLLGFFKQLLPQRPDLKLIITSATIDPERFSKHFNQAPILNISGRTYPVEIRYRPLSSADDPDNERDLNLGIIQALEELQQTGPFDTLVFLPGERQIREAADALGRHFNQKFDILPLYARLTNAQQQAIFAAHKKPRVVLATNVAETSLTVPGIRYVIDSGTARISRYSWRARIQRLPIEKVSQASAQQRAGRCGRVAAGICIRLYDEDDFNNRAEFTEAEILRTNLASVILQMDALRLGKMEDFPFVEAPDQRLIRDGLRLLQELQAVDEQQRILPLGRRMAQLPIDPRLACMLLHSERLKCQDEMLTITAALSIQDPRDAPSHAREAARQKHAQWKHEHSDFSSLLMLWNEIRQQQKERSNSAFRNWCKKQFLSWQRIREWQDIRQQLRQQLDWKDTSNAETADYEKLHRAILRGLPSHVAQLEGDGQYLGTRNRRLRIFPASALAKKSPKWMMSASLIETSQLFAHGVARVDPAWILQELEHLLAREYLEPHWNNDRQQVMALRNSRLYGLLVEGGVKVDYATFEPELARELFIREGLIEGEYRSLIGFLQHNRKLVDQVRDQEHRERRRDLLVQEEQLFRFYQALLPADIITPRQFEKWAKGLKGKALQACHLQLEDVQENRINRDSEKDFPRSLALRDQRFDLSYHFQPGNEADGVTVVIPLALLNQVRPADFDYLVPGLVEQRILALIRSLPKQWRKHFVPAPDYAHACYQRLKGQPSLRAEISQTLRSMSGIEIPPEAWQPEQIEAHLKMRFCVEQDDRCIAAGRDLLALQEQFGGNAQQAFKQEIKHQPVQELARKGLKNWDFEQLPEQTTINPDQHAIVVYPALVDYGTSVAIELFDTRAEADFYHRAGFLRLLRAELSKDLKYLHKNLPQLQQSCLLFRAHSSCDELRDDLLQAALQQCYAEVPIPRSREAFKARLKAPHKALIETANRLAETLHKTLSLWREVVQQSEKLQLSEDDAIDIEEQLDHLLYPGFCQHTPEPWFSRLPVYLQALQKRLMKLNHGLRPNADNQAALKQYWQHYLQLQQREELQENPDFIEFRWMLEEYRIAVYAQPMKTRQPVSPKRLQAVLDRIEAV